MTQRLIQSRQLRHKSAKMGAEVEGEEHVSEALDKTAESYYIVASLMAKREYRAKRIPALLVESIAARFPSCPYSILLTKYQLRSSSSS
jgi:hypothetical protein